MINHDYILMDREGNDSIDLSYRDEHRDYIVLCTMQPIVDLYSVWSWLVPKDVKLCTMLEF